MTIEGMWLMLPRTNSARARVEGKTRDEGERGSVCRLERSPRASSFLSLCSINCHLCAVRALSCFLQRVTVGRASTDLTVEAFLIMLSQRSCRVPRKARLEPRARDEGERGCRLERFPRRSFSLSLCPLSPIYHTGRQSRALVAKGHHGLPASFCGACVATALLRAGPVVLSAPASRAARLDLVPP